MSWVRRVFRPTAFRLGFFGGLGLALLVVAIFVTLEFAGPKYDGEVVSNGADVSRAGGRSITVRERDYRVFTAQCNGACDDLWYGRNVGGDTSMAVEVRDAAGRCIACDGSAYMDGGFPFAVERWTLAGPRLSVRSKTVTP